MTATVQNPLSGSHNPRAGRWVAPRHHKRCRKPAHSAGKITVTCPLQNRTRGEQIRSRNAMPPAAAPQLRSRRHMHCACIADFAAILHDLPWYTVDLTEAYGLQTDSGSAYRGSNPCVPANIPQALSIASGRVAQLDRASAF